MCREIRFWNRAALLLTLVVGVASCIVRPDRGSGDQGAGASSGWRPTAGVAGAAGGMTGGAGAAGDASATGAAGGGGNQVDAAIEAGRDATTGSGCASCGPGTTCAYSIADGCSAVGTCVAKPAGSPCWAIIAATACGCDGRLVEWKDGCMPDLPSGYAPAPIAHKGSCP